MIFFVVCKWVLLSSMFVFFRCNRWRSLHWSAILMLFDHASVRWVSRSVCILDAQVMVESERLGDNSVRTEIRQLSILLTSYLDIRGPTMSSFWSLKDNDVMVLFPLEMCFEPLLLFSKFSCFQTSWLFCACWDCDESDGKGPGPAWKLHPAARSSRANWR